MATPVLDPATAVPVAGVQAPRSRARWIMAAAVALVAGQLVLRGWTLSQSWFYDDDLIFTGRSASFPLLSTDLLLHDQDGHLMPGGFLLAGLLTRWAPLDWLPVMASMLILQALASLALLRLLRLLLGARWLLLVPLGLYVVSPLTLPAGSWWAASLNALPLEAGLAWLAADAVLVVRGGRRRWVVTGVLAYAGTLAFSEKAVLVPAFAFGVAALVLRSDGVPRPIRAAWQQGRRLWRLLMAVTVVWAAVYVSTVDHPVASGGLQGPVRTTLRGLVEGVVPALLGGPWRWDRVAPSTPWAAAPLLLVVLSVVALGAAVRWSVQGRPGAGAVWLLAGGYVALSALPASLGRSAGGAPTVFSLSLRWYADAAVVLAVALALVLRTPVTKASPRAPRWHRSPWMRGTAVAVCGAVVVGGSLWSTVTFTRTGADDRTRMYMATAARSLAAARAVPFLDQAVPDDIVGKLTAPENLASQVFAPLAVHPRFGTSTDDLRLIDHSGRVVPAEVTSTRFVAPGPLRGCGYFVGPAGPTVVPFDGPVFAWPWTVQLNYVADREGVLSVALGDGTPVRARVQRGLNTVYLRLVGGEGGLYVTTSTAGMSLCVTSGVLGVVRPR